MKKILFAVVALGVVGGLYYAFFYSPSKPQVTLAIEKPDEVRVGEPFEIKISYENGSGETLRDAKLSLSLPENTSLIGKRDNVRVDESAIGALDSGVKDMKTYSLIVLGDPQTVKRFDAKMSYGIEGSSPTFESRAKADVVIGQPAVTLEFKGPDQVASGEEFEVELHYMNTLQKDLSDVRIRLDYPPAFSFVSGKPTPTSGKNEWKLGTLTPNAEGTVSFKGNASGQEGTFLNFNIHLFSTLGGQLYEIQRQTAGMNISRSPLSISLTVNENREYAAKRGERLRYVLIYKNNSETTLQTSIISVVLRGEMFDIPTLRSNAFLNSITNTLSWNAANVPVLSSIGPGQEGRVEFEVDTKDDFPIRRLSDKNYVLKTDASMESPTVPSGSATTKTIAIDRLETKLRGELDLQASAYYYEIGSLLKNTGPYPPQANQKTQYTIHFKLLNYATDVSSVKVTALLKGGATFNGKTSPTNNPPKYNSRTGEITWEIPNIPATAGTPGVSVPLETIFQIEHIPATNQIGQTVTLLSDIRVTAKDDFTGVGLSDSEPTLGTDLPYDMRVNVDDRRVKP